MLIYPYNGGSQGAKALAEELGCRRIKRNGSSFTGKGGQLVVNWGNGALPAWGARVPLLNAPQAVNTCANKLTFFQKVGHSDKVVPWTTDRAEVQRWLDAGIEVCARTMLQANSGRGLIVVKRGDKIPMAELYTQYVKKDREFRLHLFKDQIIDFAEKKRSRDVPDDKVNWQIRSHDNGFIFAREGVEVPDKVKTVASDVFDMTDLDFGAVDVIYSVRQDRAYVLEINTAPGLEGTTVKRYAKAISDYEAGGK